MFGMSDKQAVTMTDSAIRQIVKLMERSGKEGVRIGVKKGGCAGMESTLWNSLIWSTHMMKLWRRMELA